MATTLTALALMKADLGYFDSAIPAALETYLSSTLDSAAAKIARAKIELVPGNVDDDLFLSMYAAWIYRRRASPDASGMPRMIRAELNDRKIAQAGGSA